jgi:hypothetical protein
MKTTAKSIPTEKRTLPTSAQARTALALASFAMANLLSANAALLVYEPFAYPDGWLTGQGGALGTVGTWTARNSLNYTEAVDNWRIHQEGETSGIVVDPGPPVRYNTFAGTVTNLPTSGGYVGLPGPLDVGRGPEEDFEIGRYMDGYIALDPSVTASFQSNTITWFSYVAVQAWDRNMEVPQLQLATDPSPYESRNSLYNLSNGGSGIGAGGGPPRNDRFDIMPRYHRGGNNYSLMGTPATWQDDAFTAPDATATMPWVASDADGFGAANIIVGKIEWDADTGGEDAITVVRFLETDELTEVAFEALVAAKPDLSSKNWTANKPNLDQSQFDTLNFAGVKFFLDEIRIATTFAEAVTGGAVGLQLTIVPNGSDFDLAWNSRAGMLYDVKSSADITAPRSTWTLVRGDIEATPPANLLTVPASAGPQQFYVLEARRNPTRFADDFEHGIGGWATGSEGFTGTAWELGEPSNVGPAGAHSPTNCFATNLQSDYGWDANVWLRSPAIDLTGASGATLEFWQFTAIELGSDFGSIQILDAGNNTPLAVVTAVVDGTTAEWVPFAAALPPEAVGKRIKIEFRFQSDSFGEFAGWYIDDVQVRVQ